MSAFRRRQGNGRSERRGVAFSIGSVLALLAGVGFSTSAEAACPTTPGWSKCVGDKLAVDAGGSFGQIDFEDVTYRPPFRQGSPLHASPRSGCTPKDWLFYDSVYDGYNGASPPYCTKYGACGGTDDLVHIWAEENTRHVLFKNVTIKNAFRSSSEQHIDNLQSYLSVDFGGWIVLQDSTFKNSDNENLQLGSLNSRGTYWNSVTSCEGTANMGGLVLQNVTVAQDSAFMADCSSRTGGYCGGVNGIQADNPIAVWLINVAFSAGTFSIYETGGPIIMIGTVPPNIDWAAGRFNGRRYYYSSIEDALAATQTSCQALPSSRHPDGCNAADFPFSRPPFINLSTSGWKGSSSSVPAALAPPTLLAP